jgi:hypothetical protein
VQAPGLNQKPYLNGFSVNCRRTRWIPCVNPINRLPSSGPALPGSASDAQCWAGLTGLCAGWSGAGAGDADFAPAGRRISAPNGYFSPRTINTPSPTLERIRLPFKSHLSLHSLSSINELSKLEDLPFYLSKLKSLW